MTRFYSILADAVLVLHFSYVAFVFWGVLGVTSPHLTIG